jgi:peroxiredoxin
MKSASFRSRVFPIALPVTFGFVILASKLPATITAPNLRKTAPDFALSDSNGSPVKLSDYKGQIVLLDFWATWCHGCKTEIPWYMEFQNKYKERGLRVIGVSMDDDGWKSVRPFIEQNKLNYPVVIGNETLAKQYAVDSMPVTLLLDRDSKIAETHSGMVDKNEFESDIQTLLQDNAKGIVK